MGCDRRGVELHVDWHGAGEGINGGRDADDLAAELAAVVVVDAGLGAYCDPRGVPGREVGLGDPAFSFASEGDYGAPGGDNLVGLGGAAEYYTVARGIYDGVAAVNSAALRAASAWARAVRVS